MTYGPRTYVLRSCTWLIEFIKLGYSSHPVELTWRSGSVMDCHATARSSIPGWNGVFTELHVLRKGLNDIAVERT